MLSASVIRRAGPLSASVLRRAGLYVISIGFKARRAAIGYQHRF